MTGQVRGRYSQNTSAGDRTSVDADGGAYWRHLANTVEPSVCASDTALCQITLTCCYYSYWDGDTETAGNTVEENSSIFFLI